MPTEKKMLHVPGQYSGGAGEGFEWTQRKGEVEVRVALPADHAVSCDIEARAFELQVCTHAPTVAAMLPYRRVLRRVYPLQRP